MTGYSRQHESNDGPPAQSTYSDLNATYSLTAVPPESKGNPMLRNPNLMAGRKKKAAVPTPSRGVANLTPEQLAKKRANDREAQRAIRQRTKAQIETLEQRVRELTSQQPYQDLQAALGQKRAVEKENEEIRRILSSVMAMIQPIVNGVPPPSSENITSRSCDNIAAPNGTGSERHPWSAESHIEPPSPVSHSELQASRLSTIAHQDSSLRTAAESLDLGTGPGMCAVNSPRSMEPLSPSTTESPGYALRPNWHANSVSTGQPEPRYPLTHGFNSQRQELSHGLDFSGSGERLGFNFLVDSARPVPKIPQPQRNPSSPAFNDSTRFRNLHSSQNDLFDPNIAPYTVPVRNVDPTCPVDLILLDFLHTRQREAAEGASKQILVGPPYPSVSSLLNPAKSAYSHPLSKVFTDILSKFPGISNLPEQVAVLYVMFLLMRWQIYPTQQNYDRLPEWLTPRTSQIMTPHPAWIDYLPWPRMRDRMVASYQDYDFQNWFIPYTTTLSINWPYEATDTLLSTSDSEELIINPVFERHLRNLNNWSLGPVFARAYPGLVDTTRIVPELRDYGNPAAGKSVE
ncbi:conserved hypothetical protein [Histoplasma capsulatum G186AR]|uniref:BZIP transcription factor n=2 Tax=Ajellomyces capsulatus TaxID=5037 RepID=C0NRF1_AJECG|nr:uncharacterized protein HCBG_05581 [Histoplasma capsulatum G186AR]EEH06265.1 conserved hypothetical protein [Histoplasma capsulatum G186AR]KAG5293280.1 bZIP transcription factor [Histoplasma capsulatum]QSS74731.1 bZIP transcription factor [Histoplasma capsulatum G186AR]